MKLVAGLGNPGREDVGTRHNVGFEVVDLLAQRHRVVFETAPARAMQGRWRCARGPRPSASSGRPETAEGREDSESSSAGARASGGGAPLAFIKDDVLLVKPLTFMNVSGEAIGDLQRYYKVTLPDVLVVCDDVNLPLGRLRVRGSGSEGGHNGLRSVAEQLGTTDYARLRIGVGRGDNRRDLADHVLSRFEPDEVPGIEDAVIRAADAVELWIADGLGRVMNTYNRAEDS